ncbi:MAG: lytic transglycosylase domain-containing protein [Candidatus Parcubacteria bacterium]|nr:lytic transglycosylase domain-containing protein [Burkholderiales bacterium]
MIIRSFLLTIAVLAGCAPALQAASKATAASDDAILKGQEAFRAGDPVRLQRYAGLATGHVLAPYFEYWRLKLRLEDMSDAEVRAFLQRESGSYLADRLRSDWLKVLGRRGNWAAFDPELPLLAQDDLEIRCFAWLSRLARADSSALEEARPVWQEPRELPESCHTLAEKMIAAGRYSLEDVWRRVRVLLENGQMGAARRALMHLPAGEKHDDWQFNQASTAPKTFLSTPPRSLDKRAAREMMLFAISRLAKMEPESAADALRGKQGERLSAEEIKYLWGWIAYEGAKRLLPASQQWFRLAGDSQMNDEQLAWKTRSALRAADWQSVRESIDRMSLSARQDPTWTYWYGRALGAQSQDGARAYFLRISGQPNFYGLLASEELGAMAGVPEPFHVATEADVAAAAATPGLARALELYRLELRTEATREWVFTIRPMSDAQLLAAAELARRAGIFDRAINTADRTERSHNYRVRYLTPFKEVFSEHARGFGLEEAWVLGLVRQESRFIVRAKSSAGAQGLMQLMPATASWVAKRNGLNDFAPGRVSEIPINVALGTGYLKLVLDDLGHPVLASAAYNAGPGRARRWRDVRPLEGAIYAETIPFNETRDYVKKVMANTMYYSQLIGGKLVPLKERLGLIPARSASDRFNAQLP